MIKRKTIETVEEFDTNGKLVRKVTTETNEDDDGTVQTYPWWGTPYNPAYPQVTYTSGTTANVKTAE
jgi:hypothetical protein